MGGPLRSAAGTGGALLSVARLRAECARLGIRSISVQRNTARLSGLALRESQKVRLRRFAPKAVAKDALDGEAAEVVIPLAGAPADMASGLVALLEELVPPETVDAPALANLP